MPIFEYKCERCSSRVEKWVSYVNSKAPVYCTRFEDNILKRCNGRMKRIGRDTNVSLAGRAWLPYNSSDKQLRFCIKK